ncbi:hypothetical protein OG819_46295 [Streptomyces sp. NBC_01549]|uniref:hypothetical protein n=1 Tax=Streptomyces sp. NBC_01549 TaxID=2975874 RepID=UPI00225C2D01|nr:hypothetical protein [Streptomyces sp. NBC_01549]MCX4596789.1 hypothetical protein [Streptomyces sp. NBC_01549]
MANLRDRAAAGGHAGAAMDGVLDRGRGQRLVRLGAVTASQEGRGADRHQSVSGAAAGTGAGRAAGAGRAGPAR